MLTAALDGLVARFGLAALFGLADKIALGQIDAGVSGGVDSASDAPVTVSEPLRRSLLRAAAGRITAAKAKALAAIRPTHLGIATPTNGEPRTGLSMGEHTAITAREWGIGREDQDALAAASHQRLAAAYERGFFDDLITPYLGLSRDQNLRPDSTPEKLATLRPAFGKGDRATLTAGNSTPITDGASTVVLATDRWAQDRGLRPLAYAVDGETAAVDFVTGRDPLLTAPVFALPRLLARTGMRLQDFALVENPRGLRRHRPHHARGLGVRRILPGPAGPGCADRGARQQAPECQGLIPRGRAPVRRDWRPNRRVTGKDAAREGNRGAGIDFDLRRGWPRCADDPRGSVR